MTLQCTVEKRPTLCVTDSHLICDVKWICFRSSLWIKSWLLLRHFFSLPLILLRCLFISDLNIIFLHSIRRIFFYIYSHNKQEFYAFSAFGSQFWFPFISFESRFILDLNSSKSIASPPSLSCVRFLCETIFVSELGVSLISERIVFYFISVAIIINSFWRLISKLSV